jgi:hypothetical protein
MDFARYRPRVVLAEAVAPGSLEDASAGWERQLTGCGYRFAFFDRLNRFYIAEEAAEIAARLPSEPAPWDEVAHLWDCGRAPDRPDHPDHKLAQVLQQGFFAALPTLGPALLAGIIERGLGAGRTGAFSPDVVRMLRGTAELPRAPSAPGDLPALIASDELRAALGRIACMYDGGHLPE